MSPNWFCAGLKYRLYHKLLLFKKNVLSNMNMFFSVPFLFFFSTGVSLLVICIYIFFIFTTSIIILVVFFFFFVAPHGRKIIDGKAV